MLEPGYIVPFRKGLEDTLKKYDPFQYLKKSDVNILTLGCKYAQEIPIMRSYTGKNLSFVGVDKDEEAIRQARKDHPDDHFISGDMIRVIETLPSNFDLLLMIHPEMGSPAFPYTLKKSNKLMKKGGIAFVSCYKEEEHYRGRWIIERNYELLLSERNSSIPAAFMNRFQFVSIGRKKANP